MYVLFLKQYIVNNWEWCLRTPLQFIAIPKIGIWHRNNVVTRRPYNLHIQRVSNVVSTSICGVKQRRYSTSANRWELTSIQLSYATCLRRCFDVDIWRRNNVVTRRWKNVDKWRRYNFHSHRVFDVVSTSIYDAETTSLLDVEKTLTKDVDTTFIVTMISTLDRRRHRRRNNVATTSFWPLGWRLKISGCG